MLLLCYLLMLFTGYNVSAASCLINTEEYNAPGNSTLNGTMVLKGPLYQLGNYIKCLHGLKEQYCLVKLHMEKDNASSSFWLQVQSLSNKRTYFRRDALTLGICTSIHCRRTEIATELSDIFEDAAKDLGIEVNISINEKECQTKNDDSFSNIDYVVGSFVLIIILLNILGTCADAMKHLPRTSFSKREKFLKCFSVINNFRRLSSRSKTEDSKQLRCIQGIRVLSMYFIILGHSVLFTLSGPIKNPEWLEESYNDLSRAFFFNGHIVLSTYFCISGFLLSFYFFKELDARGRCEILSIGKAIVQRYLRLTPAYALMIAIGCSWFVHFGEGPMWFEFVIKETKDCQHHWWINLLYLNNYFYVDEPCLLHTWYLAADFQNYIVTLLVLMLIWKYPSYTKTIFTTVMVVWLVVPFAQTYLERLDPTLLIIPQTINHLAQDRTYQRSYITFHNNAGSYFMGAIFGYVYYNTRLTGVKHKKTVTIMVWSIGLTLPWALMLTGFLFYKLDYSYDPLSASFYAAFSKTLFSGGIATIITGCALGHGWISNTVTSWRPFQFLGRLTYSVYLVHYCIQRLQTGAIKEPVYLTNYSLVHSSHADLLISYGLAMVLCLLVEMPASALTKLFFNQDQVVARDIDKATQQNCTGTSTSAEL